MERWILATKKADFTGLGRQLGVDPVLVRLMRTRGLETFEEMDDWLRADLSGLHDPGRRRLSAGISRRATGL